MKKTLLLMVAACTLAACNKPADNDQEAPGRRIVSMEIKNSASQTPANCNLKYNSQGQLIELNVDYAGQGSYTTTITHNESKVIVKYEKTLLHPNDPTKVIKENGTFEATLNAQKYAKTINHKSHDASREEPDTEMISTITYNANGEVVKSTDEIVATPNIIDIDAAQWSEGNMTKWIAIDENTMKYNTEKNNLTNIDLNWLIYSGEDMSFALSSRAMLNLLPMMGYCGKRSENYVTDQGISGPGYPNTFIFEYTFDADKYPTEIKVYLNTRTNPKVLSSTYKIKYNK